MQADAYDIVVVGGGLAGLSLAIRLARAGRSVALFEKETYPFHKVCGEYISLESRNDLLGLGVPLDAWALPQIRRLRVTAPDGRLLETDLPLGGFGVSRYRLDAELAGLAKKAGVALHENSRVQDVRFANDSFSVELPDRTVAAKLVFGCFGKRSNLDVKWKRRFVGGRKKEARNYVAVKYHVGADQPADTIALHNFEDGYCGLSQIEDGRYCLCYMTTAGNLRRAGHSIPRLEREILQKNPHLHEIFGKLSHHYAEPLTIAQISFAPKAAVENHVWFAGDAAGLIAPLCGNGMSMALHASKIAAACAEPFLTGKATRAQAEAGYARRWNAAFRKRIATGRFLQSFFGASRVTNLLLRAASRFPRLRDRLIRATHGDPF